MTTYTGKPALGTYGEVRGSLVYSSALSFPDGMAGAIGLPTQASVVSAMQNAGGGSGVFPNGRYCRAIDIEYPWSYETSLHLYDQSTVNTAISKYAQVMTWASAVDTFNNTLGFYDVFPQPYQDWERIVNNTQGGTSSWISDNAALSAICDVVQVFYPSFYCWENDFTKWQTFVDYKFNELSKYAPGARVIPFMWSTFYDGTSYPEAGTAIPLNTLHKMLRYLSNYVTEVIMWDATGTAWDGNAGWWQTTLRASRGL